MTAILRLLLYDWSVSVFQTDASCLYPLKKGSAFGEFLFIEGSHLTLPKWAPPHFKVNVKGWLLKRAF